MPRVHDMGGMPGQGRIVMDADEQPFHADWEARMWGINEALEGPDGWTLDWWRYVRELIRPDDYLTRPYFDQWMQVYAAMMVDSGIASVAEIAGGHGSGARPVLREPMAAADVARISRIARDFRRDTRLPPAFKAGDKVLARTFTGGAHTRLPAYLMGKAGTVHAHRGNHLFPDSGAKGGHEAQHLYTVSFASADLWPEGQGKNDRIFADLWEGYLERR
ncbi:nitrile hydratase subunit beta [Dongia sp.]|uniref:nitrile hydratase subunit beta n=1 Tax=Dongia sp. TaxID=1977262 RepID=UPI0035B0FEB6